MFQKIGRINSTWGGNLVDMVRSTKFLEIIESENLVENAANVGEYLLENLVTLENEFPHLVSQARGLGLLCAFDFPTAQLRNKFLKDLYVNHVVMLGCGEKSIRFRPPLDVQNEHIDLAMEKIRKTLGSL